MLSESTPNREREHLTKTIQSVTDLWDEPLDEVHDVPQIVNAVLAAGYRPQEGEIEYEWLRVMPDGRPKLGVTFEQMPLLDEGWTAERREVGPWVPVTEEGQAAMINLNDAPLARCNRCGRSTWTAEQVGTEDRMTQPDGNPCGGKFVAVTEEGGEHA